MKILSGISRRLRTVSISTLALVPVCAYSADPWTMVKSFYMSKGYKWFMAFLLLGALVGIWRHFENSAVGKYVLAICVLVGVVVNLPGLLELSARLTTGLIS
ncbi:MAG: hypothetical protein CME70_03205 [Halobacteriovorax sp.]|nr:hypothetical protein [Halobacteriovorax sp.]MBK22991.1 hypothetical protein [Halobacteriovorax sp.]|tara:strand:- start:7591 stop:7896 length:306 start_codon:yes stop_codon:yes gene_type:complete